MKPDFGDPAVFHPVERDAVEDDARAISRDALEFAVLGGPIFQCAETKSSVAIIPVVSNAMSEKLWRKMRKNDL